MDWRRLGKRREGFRDRKLCEQMSSRKATKFAVLQHEAGCTGEEQKLRPERRQDQDHGTLTHAKETGCYPTRKARRT